MKKNRILVVLILTLCISLIFSTSIFAQNESNTNSQNSRMVADSDQIKILQNLYNKDISYGELVEKVYPDALERISEKVLQNMYNTKVNWKKENPPSIVSTSTFADESTDNSLRAPIIIEEGIEHNSSVVKGSGYIAYNSRSTVVQPFGLVMPYMAVFSMLIQDGEGPVASVLDTGGPTFQVFASDFYYSPLSGRSYYTQGSHWGEYIYGSQPPTYQINTSSGMIMY